MATIKDIAREAGVSHGTVSNVLNKTGKVSIEKIRLVEAAAKKLGYIPNIPAQQLRQGFKKHVAVIIPSFEIDCYMDLYNSIKNSLSDHDYEVLVYTTEGISGLEESILEQLPLSSISAIVTISSLFDSKTAYKVNCPVVFVNRDINSRNSKSMFISFDFKKAGIDIGEYIVKSNWNKAAFFSSHSRFQEDKLLYEGLSDSLINSDASLQRFSSDTSLAVNRAFDILSSDENFDVIVTSSLPRAEAIATAIRFSNLSRPPKILTVASYKTFSNNHFITYEMNYKHMGKVIADMLLNYFINNKVLKKELTLEATGFRFQFPNIKKRERKSLTMLTLPSPTTQALQKLSPYFFELTGINLKINVLSYNDLYSHMEIFNENYSYDMVRMDVAWFSELAEKVYKPLNISSSNNHEPLLRVLRESLNSYTSIGDTSFALPFDPSVQILLFRKDLFEDALVKRAYYELYRENLEVPKNFTEYNKIASFFTQSINPLSPTKFGTTLTFGSPAVASCDFLPRLISEMPELYSMSSEIRLDSPEGLRAMDNYIECYKYTNKKENPWWQDSIREFAQGNCAMSIVFSNYASNIINSRESMVVGKVGAAIIPGGYPLLGGGVIVISKYSRALEECMEFFNWYYSSEISSAIFMLGGSSPYTSSLENTEDNAMFPWVDAAKNSFSLGKRNLTLSDASNIQLKKFEFILGSAVRGAVNGNMKPKEALQYAKELLER